MNSRQRTYSWLLLTILLSMQALNAVHIHEQQEVSYSQDYCEMCAHHVKHDSHISGEHYHMHPCLSCMIGSSQYVNLQPSPVWSMQQCVTTIDCKQVISLPIAIISQRQTRAPPVFLV